MGTATEIEKTAVKSKSNGKTVALAKVENEELIDANIFTQRVEKKAYELYQKRGCQDGYDCDDWYEAERIVETEMIAGK